MDEGTARAGTPFFWFAPDLPQEPPVLHAAKNTLVDMIRQNSKKQYCRTRLGNGSQRRGVKLDPNQAWPSVSVILDHYPDMKKKIFGIVGQNPRLVTCATIVCYGDCDQKPHRDHTFGFGKVAGFVVDLDNMPLYTQFFENLHKGTLCFSNEPVICVGPVLAYDTFTFHAGSGARRFPGIKKSNHRLFCEFMDTCSPDCSGILLQSGSRKRKRYPPPLLAAREPNGQPEGS